jgi:Kef-type K+ transport system membrane component KefB
MPVEPVVDAHGRRERVERVRAVVPTRRVTPHRIALLLGRMFDASSQLPIRIAVLLVAFLVWVAGQLGLNVLLGGFAAGLAVRLANQGENAAVIDTKLSALAFGMFVPVFFVVSGISFDLDALTASPATLLCVPLFLTLFLVVRGIPTLVSQRRELGLGDRVAAALLASTALPVVVAITKIGLDRHDMKPENAAALIAAGMLSVLILPAVAFGLRRRRDRPAEPTAAPDRE